MNISHNWLSLYVDLPASVDALDLLLTNAGLEVEAIHDQRAGLRGIVVGEVLTCSKHPNADKLSVCEVSDGIRNHTVVCGAPNVRAGQKIAFAPVGTVIAKLGFTIERKKIRGTESAGMICSSSELGIDEDHSGIMVLPSDVVPGQPLQEAMPALDIRWEIGITPNRGDALSHVGIARDIAASARSTVRLPELATPADSGSPEITVRIMEPALCPRYSCAVLRGISNGPSPEWLRQRMESIGLRSINTVVDITNFVMMEIGQPMHAFDLRTIEGKQIVVRTASVDEEFTTLDGVQHKLPADTLLICDAVKPVAIAGVMGGQNSEISHATTDVLLESAYFQSTSVRRTSKTLGVSTDSSYRFERGTDPDRTVWALRRAIDLLLANAGGSFEGIVDACPSPYEPKVILLRPERVNEILGIEIPAEEQRSILDSLEIACQERDNGLLCSIPGFRSDLSREIDLIEEIARMFGYDRISVPRKFEILAARQYDDETLSDRLRNFCLGIGLDEVLTSSLIPTPFAKAFSRSAVVDVLNPVSAERPSLRPSLFPSMLESVDYNIRNGARALRIFEIGTIFLPSEVSSSPVSEQTMLSVVLSGNSDDRTWYSRERPVDFYDVKGVVEALLRKLCLDNDFAISYDADVDRSANGYSFEVEGVELGRIIQFPPHVLRLFGIEQDVFGAEFSLDALAPLLKNGQKMRRISRFPVVLRDLAFIIDQNIDASSVVSTVEQAGTAYVTRVEIIDVFFQSSFGRNKKSMAISISFQSEERTLSEKEIAADMDRIIEALHRNLDATLRV